MHTLFKDEKLEKKVGYSWCISINADAMMSQNFRTLIVSHPVSKEEKLGKKRQISENDRHMLFLVGWNIGLVPEEW